MLITISERYENVMRIFDEVGEARKMSAAYISRATNSIYRYGKFVMEWQNPYVFDFDENGNENTEDRRLFNKAMFMQFLDRQLNEEKEFLRARGCGVKTVEFLRMVGKAMRERGI